MVEDKPVYTREHVEKCNSLLGTFQLPMKTVLKEGSKSCKWC